MTNTNLANILSNMKTELDELTVHDKQNFAFHALKLEETIPLLPLNSDLSVKADVMRLRRNLFDLALGRTRHPESDFLYVRGLTDKLVKSIHAMNTEAPGSGVTKNRIKAVESSSKAA